MDRDAIAAVAALDDDVRAALYACVRDADAPVTREQAAATVGVSRKLAAFHLDKLVDLGLLQAGVGRTATPRVGRSPKVYRPSERSLAVELPPRDIDTLTGILIDAVAGERPGERGRDAALRTAREAGERLGACERERLRPGRLGVERALSLTHALLQPHGFAPQRDAATIRLRNCPFHPHAQAAPELVCALNHAYLCGVLAGLGAESVIEAVLAPPPGLNCPGRSCPAQCCVAICRRDAHAGPD